MNKEKFINIWKQRANSGQLTSTDFVMRAIFIAASAKATNKTEIAQLLLQRYFTPITNKTKIENGAETLLPIKNIMCRHWYLDRQAKRNIVYGDVDTSNWKNPEISLKILGQSASEFMTEEEFQTFKEVWDSVDVTMIHRQYIHYFTVKKVGNINLTPEQMAVQSAHVTLKLGTTLPRNINPNTVYFQWHGVEDGSELRKILTKLSKTGHENYVMFRESDYRNSLTSVAFAPVLWNQQNGLGEYELMKFEATSGAGSATSL